jgi:hypothetical protein
MTAAGAFEVEDWRGGRVAATRSPSGVLLLLDYQDNLLPAVDAPWPPPALVAKLGESHHAESWPADIAEPVSERLGHYCALQSINSEDAATWSFFGPPMLAPAELRGRFLSWLLAELDVDAPRRGRNCTIDLWRRIPHPEKPAAPGPELDVVADGDDVVVFVEAKWGSPQGVGQGVDQTSTQMGLRRAFLERYGGRIYGDRRFIVMGVVVADPIEAGVLDDTASAVVTRTITWSQLCGFAEHPVHAQLRPYLEWKLRHSTWKPRAPARQAPTPPRATQRWWVPGRPATFATKGEQPWKAAIRQHVPVTSPRPSMGGVVVEFVLDGAQEGAHAADLDNLLDPLCSALVNGAGWFGGVRTNIEWIHATKRYGEPTGAVIEATCDLPSLSSAGSEVVLDAVFAGPLPTSARDHVIADWVLSAVPPSPVGRVAVALRFGKPRLNLGDTATGPVKSVIDGLWPLLGGKPGQGEDWRIRALQLTRGAPEVPAAGVEVTVLRYDGERQ